jgi:hypothetical protein
MLATCDRRDDFDHPITKIEAFWARTLALVAKRPAYESLVNIFLSCDERTLNTDWWVAICRRRNQAPISPNVVDVPNEAIFAF